MRSYDELVAEADAADVVDSAPSLPTRMAVTEGWPPNAAMARNRLGPRGVQVVDVDADDPLPWANASFELVTSRHPVRTPWAEIGRVLQPGGRYLAQHVGPASAFELIEWFTGPLPDEVRDGRHPRHDRAGATAAGLVVDEIGRARCRMEFFDIGAVVYILRKCVWWVPDFTVQRYDARLHDLDAQIRRHGAFVAHSSRLLVRAHRPIW